MNEPQVWVLIGVFAAAMASMITIVTTSFSRQLSSSMVGVAGRFSAVDAQFSRVDAQFAAVDAKLDAIREVMEVRFGSIERRLDGLDRDVAMLIRRSTGVDPE